MLELMKTVLKNVSHDAQYFRKEFSKAQKWLSEEEFLELQKYLKSVLGNTTLLETDDLNIKR